MKTISVCSFKGGTAKTSISLNLAAAIAKFYTKKVLLVDFDAQANLTSGLGFDPDHYDSMSTVLQNQKTISEVTLETKNPLIKLIPADTFLERVYATGELSSDRYSHEKLKTILSHVDSYDFTIIDTPPSLCWLTESSLIACDYAIVCSTPEFYSVKGLQRLSYFMDYISERHPFEMVGVALSFWSDRGKNNKNFIDIIEDIFPQKLFSSKIRRDISVSEASIQGQSVFDFRPKSRAAFDYKNITKEIMDKILPKKQESHV